MPQRGYGLQPRVAASATLGKESDLALNRKAVALLCTFLSEKPTQPRQVGVEISFLTSSQGSRSGNPGLEAEAPLGHLSLKSDRPRSFQLLADSLHLFADFDYFRQVAQCLGRQRCIDHSYIFKDRILNEGANRTA